MSIRLDGESILRVKVHYDTRSQNTLGSCGLNPIVISRRQSKFPIDLSTITDSVRANRPIVSLRLNGYVLDAIIIKNLRVDNVTMPIPVDWK